MENVNNLYEITLTHTFNSDHLLSSPAHLFEHLFIRTIKMRFKNKIDIYGMTTSKNIKIYINTTHPISDFNFKYIKDALNKRYFSRKLMIQEIIKINHEISYISFLLRKELPLFSISKILNSNIFFEFNKKIDWFSQKTLVVKNQMSKTNENSEVFLFQDNIRIRALAMIKSFVFQESMEKYTTDNLYKSPTEVLITFQMSFIGEITDGSILTISELIKDDRYLHNLVVKKMKVSAIFHPEIMIKNNTCTLFLYTFGLLHHFTPIASMTTTHIKSKDLQCDITWDINYYNI